MKKRAIVFLALPFVFACNNGSNDSVQKADSANESKSDTSTSMNTTDTTSKMSTVTMSVDQPTSEFMTKVADVGMTEVKLGQMAQDKAISQRVKDFGAMMVKDHTAAGDELKTWQTKKCNSA